MRSLLITACCFGCIALAQSQPVSAADKPTSTKWEYAELAYRMTPPRPAGKDGDGNEVAAVPATMSIRWTTGAEEVNVKGWNELAEKLNAPIKKDLSPTSQKIQMLNLLGAEGWELIEQQGNLPLPPAGGVARRGIAGGPGGMAPGGFGGGVRATATISLLFKRRVP